MPAHDRLRSRITNQARELRNGDHLRDLVRDARAILEGNTPTQTGTLVRNITQETPVRESEKGLTAGLGDKGLVGSSSSGAPRGVIAQFLIDFPEFRGTTISSRGAWWGLPLEGKRVLQQERESGRYGGATGVGVGKSPYFYAQEGSFSNWNRSAAKAGIEPLQFVAQTLEEWRGNSVPRIMASFRRRFAGV